MGALIPQWMLRSYSNGEDRRMTRPVTETLSAHVQSPEQIPPLEPGDRLTRPEFERRYAAMPQLHKAELIEGVVHMPSPVRFRRHGRPQAY